MASHCPINREPALKFTTVLSCKYRACQFRSGQVSLPRSHFAIKSDLAIASFLDLSGVTHPEKSTIIQYLVDYTGACETILLEVACGARFAN